jgi:hypothetical protein
MRSYVKVLSVLASGFIATSAFAQFGACCAGHGGVCECKDGGVICCDGFTGSSCPCPQEQQEIKVPGQIEPIKVLPTEAPQVAKEAAPKILPKVERVPHAMYLPDRELTPGDIRSKNLKEICKPGYVGNLPRATEENKAEAYRLYGIKNRQGYEIDHLVSKGTGGSSEVPNLWPQKRTGDWNMSHKDRLENHLNKMVCAGQVKLQDAQEALRKDWVSAYRKYIGELESSSNMKQKKKSAAVKKKS